MNTAEAQSAPKVGYYRKVEPVRPVSDEMLMMKRLRSFAATRPVRSKVWMARVKRLPCKCGAPADEAHHMFGSFMSLKTSDLFTVPRCRSCHQREPDLNPEALEEWVRLVHEYLRDKYASE